mmetsp:Transcript_9273/g.15072  ORF Transcript_9273/g.15072 Transcript_9273/m.15072 type:complete len:191 (-) Transcript_9273:2874-3446(-)
MGMCKKKPMAAVRSYDACHMRSCMVYHMTYHYSIGVHVNHLVFLNTYLFGMLMLANAADWILAAVLTLLYAIYAIWLARLSSFLFVIVLCGLNVGALYLADWIWEAGYPDYVIALVGFAFVLGSFIMQLLGHWLFEKFQGPLSLLHGFLLAPLLELVMFQYRIGLFSSQYSDIVEAVNQARCVDEDVISV